MEENANNIEAEVIGNSYPEDYSLNTLNFITSVGNKINILKLMSSLSVYEDLYSFSLSGHITLIDAQGFMETLKLTGNEFLEMEFGKVKDAPNRVKQKFRVYRAGDRTPSGTLNSELYTLYFCSEELMLSEQTKISKSYKGKKVSDIVADILVDKLKIPNKKIENVEETMGVYDFLIPRMKPFEAISWLSCYARPKSTIGADMLFFETKDGYNFRSIQSMLKDPTYGTYKYQAKNLDNKVQSFKEKVSTVIDYEFGKPYDALNEINSGTLTNRLISIDPIARKFKITDFDYNKYKSQAKSLNSSSPTNDYKNRLGVSETQAYEGKLKVIIGNAEQQNVQYIKSINGAVAKDIFVETFVPNRTAQISLSNYTTLKIAIPGDPGISIGRTINFNLLSLSAKDKDLDKMYSGKYLVTAVRHIIDAPTSYKTILELAKDSTPTPTSSINNDDASWKEMIQA
jgi:hypothetical protein